MMEIFACSKRPRSRRRRSRFFWVLPIAATTGLYTSGCAADQLTDTLPAWSEGYLDIHHINTGRGDAMFAVLPDGTNLLFDAGDLDGHEFEQRAAPLKLVPQRPSEDVTPGNAIAEYIRAVSGGDADGIDYALISHFHGDHFGTVRGGLEKSGKGDYLRTGITEVGDELPITVLIDRAWPNYNDPVDLAEYHGESFRNYLSFLRHNSDMQVQSLGAGQSSQITLVHTPGAYPTFNVRNIASSGESWTGVGENSERLFDTSVLLNEEGRFTENPLSLSIVINYGDFDYFTGGDMTGLRGPGIGAHFDVETPVGNVIGEVDVLALNHHGNRDATNERFLAALKPRVLVQQTWVSDHPGGEVVHRMASEDIYSGPRDVFATHILEETEVAIGPWLTNLYDSKKGHVVIRVTPGGEEFYVYILDDTSFELTVLASHGPYQAQ